MSDVLDDSPPLFNTDQFRSLQSSISLENSTTQTRVHAGKRTIAGELDPKALGLDLTIRLVEIHAEETPPVLALEVPLRTCAEGHTLQLQIQVRGPQKLSYQLNVAARVKSAQKVGDGRDQITVSLIQPDMGEWERFLSIYSSKQAEVEDLLRRMKDRG